MTLPRRGGAKGVVGEVCTPNLLNSQSTSLPLGGLFLFLVGLFFPILRAWVGFSYAFCPPLDMRWIAIDVKPPNNVNNFVEQS